MRHIIVLLSLSVAVVACRPVSSEVTDVPPAVTPSPDLTSYRLPDPTGPYAVGHLRFSQVDASREEIHSSQPGDQRDLLMEVWYPAETSSDAEPALYMAEPLAAALDLDPLINQTFAHALEDALLLSGSDPLPVVIFNDGYTGLPTGYTALLEEYASHGYVVATTSHPYADELALLSDGTVVPYPGDEAFLAALGTDDPFGAETYLNWIPDTIALLHALDRLNGEMFEDRLVLDRLAFVGHSFGGGVSAETCRILADRCVAAINLDGSHAQRLQQVGMPLPYLYLAAGEGRVAASPELQQVISTAQSPMTVVEIAGATHFGFGDGYYVWQVYGQPDDVPADHFGAIDPLRMTEIVRAFSLAFLDQHMRSPSDQPSLEVLADAYPEVTVRVYQPGE